MCGRLIAEGVISGGMIPKAEAALRALETTERVHIVDGGESTCRSVNYSRSKAPAR